MIIEIMLGLILIVSVAALIMANKVFDKRQAAFEEYMGVKPTVIARPVKEVLKARDEASFEKVKRETPVIKKEEPILKPKRESLFNRLFKKKPRQDLTAVKLASQPAEEIAKHNFARALEAETVHSAQPVIDELNKLIPVERQKEYDKTVMEITEEESRPNKIYTPKFDDKNHPMARPEVQEEMNKPLKIIEETKPKRKYSRKAKAKPAPIEEEGEFSKLARQIKRR